MNAQCDNKLPKIPARTWKIAAVAGAAAFMAMLDSTVTNLAIETIRTDFASTLPTVQWITTGYLIALTVSIPTTGWLCSRYGCGRVWTVSVAGFVVASALCGIALELPTLIIARLLQGLAAGLMVPAGQAVIGSHASSNQLGRLMGSLGFIIALGPALGPGIGGLVLEVTSWRWLFWINIPIGITALVAARNLIPNGSTKASRPLHRTGLVLISLGFPLLLFGVTEMGSESTTTIVVLATVTGVVLVSCFVLTTLCTPYPLIDLRLLRGRVFSAATITAGLTGANMYGGLLLLPLYLQLIMNRGAGGTGLMLLIMGLGSAIALPVAGTLTDRFGASKMALAGAGTLLATTVPFVIFPNTLSVTTLMLLMTLRGGGIALAQMPAMTAAYASVTTEQMGDTATLVNIALRAGGAIGAAGVATLLAEAGGVTTINAYVLVFVVLTVLALFTVVSAAFMRLRPVKVTEK
jgi:EmrB/QacA subfamily drug resistance transporter